MDTFDITCNTYYDQLVQTAVVAKLVVELFTDTFCIVHRCVVDELSWEEWDSGPMASRFGSLCFTMQRERGQRHRIMTLGVVNIPDNDPFPDDMHRKLAKRICSDNVCVSTGTFGKGNEKGIERTAVAAGASVGHRICTRFKGEGASSHVTMSGGFFVFAPYNILFESLTELGADQLADLGDDIADELLPETASCSWSIVRGNEHCPNQWDIKLKPMSWEHHLRGMVRTRVYLGIFRVGKRNRKLRWGDPLEGEKDRSCGEMHPLEEGDPLEGESQQLLHHTAHWKNMIRAKQQEVEYYRRVAKWEQAMNATAPNQHAPQKRTHEEIEHEDQPETAVAAYGCRARRSSEGKRQKVELPLVPRQPVRRRARRT